jgi:transglutaminase-like putative cysteine protease
MLAARDCRLLVLIVALAPLAMTAAAAADPSPAAQRERRPTFDARHGERVDGAALDEAPPALEGGRRADDTPVLIPSDEPPKPQHAKPAITYWNVALTVQIEPSADPVHVGMLVPVSDGRQAILSRTIRPSAFRFREETFGPNLRVHWDAGAVKAAKGAISYTITARSADLWVDVPRNTLAANPPLPDGGDEHLGATDTIQAGDPGLRHRAAALTRDAERVDEIAWSLYQYAASFLRGAEGAAAPSDALGVLAAERGSGAGKARLLAALFRSIGIPARLVGGLRLEDASRKRSTISWVEAWLGGTWVPFDPANGNYAHVPTNHLALYYGDLPLIEHTAGIGFHYDMLIHQVTRRSLLAQDTEAAQRDPARAREVRWETDRVRTFAFYA